MSEYDRERYAWYKQHGICVDCGTNEAYKGHTRCLECRFKGTQKRRSIKPETVKRMQSIKDNTSENYEHTAKNTAYVSNVASPQTTDMYFAQSILRQGERKPRTGAESKVSFRFT